MVTDAELNQIKESSEQQTTDLQLALVDVYEQALTVQQSNEQQTTRPAAGRSLNSTRRRLPAPAAKRHPLNPPQKEAKSNDCKSLC